LNHLLIYATVAVVLLSAALYFFQEKFIFKPEKLSQDFEFRYSAPFKELFFDV
jgi:hypothetical protein